MKITLLLDHDIEGYLNYLAAAWHDSNWDQVIQVEFKILRDYGLPDDLPDQEIWRFAQAHHRLLITANRNNDDATSLQATLRRENTTDSLPVITISRREGLKQSAYRRRVVLRLAEIIFDLDDHLGLGRLFVP